MRRIPEKLLDVTLQPLMFVLLFAFVFGGVIHVPDGNYRKYVAHAVAGFDLLAAVRLRLHLAPARWSAS